MTIARVVVAVVAAVTIFVTPFTVTGPRGTVLDESGAAVDVVALVVLVATVAWMWRDRAHLA